MESKVVPSRFEQLWSVERTAEYLAVSVKTRYSYRRELKNHVLPAMGAVRLAEATTPLVDRVIAAIRTQICPATATSCKSVISGVMALAVR